MSEQSDEKGTLCGPACSRLDEGCARCLRAPAFCTVHDQATHLRGECGEVCNRLDAAIARSSLGTPEAAALRASVSDEEVVEVVARAKQLEQEKTETYTVEDIRLAFAVHASKDEWGVLSFYLGGLLAALRGEYDDPDVRLGEFER